MWQHVGGDIAGNSVAVLSERSLCVTGGDVPRGTGAVRVWAEGARGGGARDIQGSIARDGQLVLSEPVLHTYQLSTYTIGRVCCEWLEQAAKAGGDVRGALLGQLLEQGKLLRWLSWMELLNISSAQVLLQVALILVSPTATATEPHLHTSCAEGLEWNLSQKQAHQVGSCVVVETSPPKCRH